MSGLEWRCRAVHAAAATAPQPPSPSSPFGRGHSPGLLARSGPSFPFQSQPHECRKLWPKINNTTQGRSGRRGGEGWKRQREMERRARRRNVAPRLFLSPLLFLQKCPLFLFPSLFSPGPSNEWHYRQCHIQSDTNLFRFAAPQCISTGPGAICLGTIWFP